MTGRPPACSFSGHHPSTRPTLRPLPTDYAWNAAQRAFKRRPHPPGPMIPGDITGPIKMWVCGIDGCDLTAHTISPTPPTCSGGLPYDRDTPETLQDAPGDDEPLTDDL